MEELRNHDARPDAREREWMAVNPFAVLVRLVALAGLAIAIGVSATHLVNPAPQPTVTAAHE